jgi:hypothetical protein
VSDGVAPPASAFPRLSNRTAVQAETLAPFFQVIPGVRFPDRISRPRVLDFGPDIEHGIAQYPAKAGKSYRTYVSALDADGNEVGGIRGAELLAPLATYAGWNLRSPEQGAPGDLMQMMGSTLAFPRTRAEREQRRDPRPSIEERYGSRAGYLGAVRDVAQKLVANRHVLAEDVDAILERAGRVWDYIHA